MGILISILIGALAGWIAGQIMGLRQTLLINIGIGILGAIVGNGILTFVFGTTAAGLVGQIIVAAAGACLLIAVFRAVRR